MRDMVTTRSSRASLAPEASPTSAPSSSSPPSHIIDPVSKAKTLSHMNNDHQNDLVSMLRHYAQLSPSQASNPTLLDMDLSSMTVSCGPAETEPIIVPFEPPMASWNERRSKLVEMTMEAREALGIVVPDKHHAKGTTVQTPGPQSGDNLIWLPPTGVAIAAFLGVNFYYLCASLVFTGYLAPNTPLGDFIKDTLHFPYSMSGFCALVKGMFVPVIGIHFVEMGVIDRTRLAPAGLRRGSGVWWAWMGSVLTEGYPAMMRWDRMMEARKGKMQ